MTKEEVEIYELCKKDLNQKQRWLDAMPFTAQIHGCGSSDPQIYHHLQKIHETMNYEVRTAIKNSMLKIEKIIEDL